MNKTTAFYPNVTVENKTINGQIYNLAGFVKRIVNGDSFSSPAQTLMLEITPDAQLSTPGVTAGNIIPFWYKTIETNDILSIGISREKSFLFKVDRVARFKRITEKGIEKGIRILARSMISTLLDDDVIFAPEFAISKKAHELLGNQRASFLGLLRGWTEENASSIFVDQNPLAVIMWIFLNMPSISSKTIYKDYDEQGGVLREFTDKVGSLFDFELMAYEADLMYDQALSQYSGKIWNYIMQCIDPMFYELYEESVLDSAGKLRSKIIIRPRPFDRSTDNTKDDKIIRISVTNTTADQAPAEQEQGTFTPAVETESRMLGDFIITKKEKKVGNIEGTAYDVSIRGYDKQTHRFDDSIKRVELKWDNLAGNDFKTIITGEPFHTITEDMEYAEDIGHDSFGIVNYITMHPAKETLVNTELARLGYLYPWMDADSVLRYGIRKMDGRTSLMHATESREVLGEEDQFTKNFAKAKIFPLSESVKLRDRLGNWNRYNGIHETGSSMVLGNDNVRKGDKAFYPHHYTPKGHIGVYYYIFSVNREWFINENGTNYLMTLELSRGENPEYINEYNFATGYDLFDKDIEQEGERRNPIIKIDEVMLEERPTVGGKKTNEEISTGVLTDAAVQMIKAGFDLWKNKSGVNRTRNGGPGYSAFGITQPGIIIQTIADCACNPNVITAIIQYESKFDTWAVSATGCSGLGQFCMGTANKGRMAAIFAETGKQFYAQGNDQKVPGEGGLVKNKDDARFDPIANIKAIDALLIANKFNNGNVASQREALRVYGDNAQQGYATDIIGVLKKIEPGNPLVK